ncbi:thiazole biosynthesis adenylyltransferase ThiF [Halobacillus faecis]|uniref:Thiazole biosynthesis adenylyltransferase ThiF n=1 Tax=Halobacillus faecis TaxID=360184 RepID=A0A511WV71_9BACI|nr:thiazole biosynthesis adenylyltransferase ThiF [Halobacillus faecis]GEN55050.1 thiazole biosynthesis adenylyltransferase ThiF [Halobacillus faecis]
MPGERYSRQQLFQPIGEKGQRRLEESHVLIVGAGALGTSSSEQLVRAGVGKITVIDRDYVEFSNLQRQQLFTERDAENRLPKAVAAKSRLEEVNSEVQIHAVVADVQAEELKKYAQGIDMIIDGTDNFETRMLINDFTQRNGIPWVYGGCVGSHGMSYTIIPGSTPCLSCLMRSIPLGAATCDTVGVISPAVQMVAAHQVTEALKVLVGDVESIRKGLVTFDLWTNDYTSIKTGRIQRQDCPSCGKEPNYPYLFGNEMTKVAVLCGRDTVQIRPGNKGQRDLEELKNRLSDGEIQENPFLLSYKTSRHRMVFFRDGRVLIHGTNDIKEAKTLYHKIVGG